MKKEMLILKDDMIALVLIDDLTMICFYLSPQVS